MILTAKRLPYLAPMAGGMANGCVTGKKPAKTMGRSWPVKALSARKHRMQKRRLPAKHWGELLYKS